MKRPPYPDRKPNHHYHEVHAKVWFKGLEEHTVPRCALWLLDEDPYSSEPLLTTLIIEWSKRGFIIRIFVEGSTRSDACFTRCCWKNCVGKSWILMGRGTSYYELALEAPLFASTVEVKFFIVTEHDVQLGLTMEPSLSSEQSWELQEWYVKRLYSDSDCDLDWPMAS